MSALQAGHRVQTQDGAGRIYSIDHSWAAVILDRDSHRNNPSVYWAPLDELTPETTLTRQD